MTESFDLGPAVADATNVLLVAPGVGDTADRLCCDVLTADEPPEHVVGVTISEGPEEKASRWRELLGPAPSLSMLGLDGVTRSAAVQQAPTADDTTVEYLDSSETIRELGERIATKIHRETDTAVCFDSITDLQECMGRETAFEFLHVLGSRVRAGGATGYYYIDRTVHDEETMTLYSTLFDAAIEVGSDAGTTGGN
ncbi:hypothetical protein GOC74_00765 [Halomicrobium mukohataei]|uniref:Recombinase RecA n=1 Tax=Halomicrobium mukohataei TaxID=57705 RepID=A0A847U840_9EURY|nr:hypothetical protein [Halomicrobium mukohataei]